ncbi:polysaccharide biosynthesis protein [uncultured Bacteroides sp.]|uniref:polysaccharide biosynthesis protein n=1 Tax=uncultured Bacteroides sp. TaxID=162156 RepID=UPI002AAB2BDE|nr:polysaccharide biosynthesis protein [uncultured Bacteroides sp.]
MIDINRFIERNVTFRNESMFQKDIDANSDLLREKIEGKSILVIGGAGTIGSSFIRAVLKFKPAKLTVVDISENGLAELSRDLRSSYGTYVPKDFITYPINYADPVFKKMFRSERGFDIVANFSAHKHVRSEKDEFSVQALLENNVLHACKLLKLLTEIPPRKFFCVSTDKAANPVNLMGGSKKIMEDMIMGFSNQFNITTARFANVAFSNGSLLAGFIERVMKRQPLSAPADVRRYFVSPDESGQICMLACMLGQTGEIYFPKLGRNQMLTFSEIATSFLKELGYNAYECSSEEEARRMAFEMKDGDMNYPVYYSNSDTTGEKSVEEFYTNSDVISLDEYVSLGVVKNSHRRRVKETEILFTSLNAAFASPYTKKSEIVGIVKKFLVNFEHIEKGKNLDSKM